MFIALPKRKVFAMFIDRMKPRRIPSTGDDRPVKSALHFAWRMGGRHQVLISLVALVVAALSMAPLELQRRLVNNAIEGDDVHLLLVLAGLYLAVLVLQSATKFVLRMYQGWLSESAIRYTRGHLAALIDRPRTGTVERDAAADQDRNTGERDDDEADGRAVSIIGQEVDRLGGFVGEGISQPVVNLGMLVAILGYMIAVEPVVALISMAFLVPQLAIVPIIQRRINRLIEKRLALLRDMSDDIAGHAGDGGDGLAGTVRPTLGAVYTNRMRTYFLKFVMKGATNALSALAPLAVLLVGGYYVIIGETSIGVVVAFITGFERLSNPLRELINYYKVAAQANVQHRMIARWM
ncbi:MAG: ABC transporter ATP-binding protein [Azospirillaceae bacterium]